MSKISVVIATFNEEKNISRCLSSVQDLANEIILVDAKSSDRTVEIAKKYKPRIFLVDNEPIFHKNKQYGLDKAQMEWILQLDADEIVSKELASEIHETIQKDENELEKYQQNLPGKELFLRHKKIIEQRDGQVGKDTGEYAAFFIPRLNYFLGRFLKHGGIYPDGVIRLVKKGKAQFPCKSVHEQIVIEGRVGWLQNCLLHYSSPTFKEYLIKANRYTALTAEDLKRNNTKINIFNTLKYCLFIPCKTFFNIYIRHQGYLDGLPGFVWAVLSSTHYFLAYAKLIKTKNL